MLGLPEGPLSRWTSSSPTTRSRCRRACASFLDGRFPLDAVRAIEAAGHLDRDRWRELGETGVFSLTLPEADGGLELGVSEAVLVFEELGRALVPGPLVATFLAAPCDRRRRDRRDDRRPLRARRRRSSVVEHLADLDALLVLDADGVRRLDPAADRHDAGRAPARRAHAARRSSTATCPRASSIADAAAAERAAPRRHGAHRRAAARPRAARHRARHRVRQGARAVRPRRSARSRRSSTSAPTCSCAPRWRAPRCTPPRSRSTAAATTTRRGPRRRPRSWPATPPSPTARPASRCTAGSGSRGRSTRSASGSAPCVLDTHFGNSDEHAEAVAAML